MRGRHFVFEQAGLRQKEAAGADRADQGPLLMMVMEPGQQFRVLLDDAARIAPQRRHDHEIRIGDHRQWRIAYEFEAGVEHDVAAVRTHQLHVQFAVARTLDAVDQVCCIEHLHWNGDAGAERFAEADDGDVVHLSCLF